MNTLLNMTQVMSWLLLCCVPLCFESCLAQQHGMAYTHVMTQYVWAVLRLVWRHGVNVCQPVALLHTPRRHSLHQTASHARAKRRCMTASTIPCCLHMCEA